MCWTHTQWYCSIAVSILELLLSSNILWGFHVRLTWLPLTCITLICQPPTLCPLPFTLCLCPLPTFDIFNSWCITGYESYIFHIFLSSYCFSYSLSFMDGIMPIWETRRAVVIVLSIHCHKNVHKKLVKESQMINLHF